MNLTINTGARVYWAGPNAFFSAETVNVSLLSNGLPTYYSFQDDWQRPVVVNSGGRGEEISREDDWVEQGLERRLKFYFAESEHSSANSNSNTTEHIWRAYESRLYDSTEEWVYSLPNNEDDVALVLAQAPMRSLYHCDLVTTHYCDDQLPTDVDTSTPPSACPRQAIFQARDMILAGFLEDYYNICSADMEVFNPCEDNKDGRTFCHSIDGVVQCQEPPPHLSSSSPPSTATTMARSSSTKPRKDSRHCVRDSDALDHEDALALGSAGQATSVCDPDQWDVNRLANCPQPPAGCAPVVGYYEFNHNGDCCPSHYFHVDEEGHECFHGRDASGSLVSSSSSSWIGLIMVFGLLFV